MRILGSVESIGAVQGILIITVRENWELLLGVRPRHSFWSESAKELMAEDVHLACCVCVVTTSRADETCGVETSLWCNQQLTQRYNMQPIGVKEERRRAGGQGHCLDMACCDS